MNPVDINKYNVIYMATKQYWPFQPIKHLYSYIHQCTHKENLILTNYIYAGYTWCGGGDAIVIANRKQRVVKSRSLL